MKTLTLLTLLATTALTSSLARAEDQPKPLAELEKFVGSWKGTANVTMGKDTVKAGVAWTCKRTSAKAGVLCSGAFTGIPGMPVYEETDLFGYEAGTNTYHWFAVTNAGETHDHVAKVAEGKLQFVFTGTQESKPFKEVIDVDMSKDGKSLSLRAETFVAGASTSVFDLKAKK